MPTGAAKGEGAILLPLDCVQCVEQAIVFFYFHLVLSPIRSLIFLRIKASNLQGGGLHLSSSHENGLAAYPDDILGRHFGLLHCEHTMLSAGEKLCPITI